MPWSLIVGLLIDFLVKWLTSLFQQTGQFSRSVTSIQPDRIAQHKADFLAGVKLRFWIGSKRMEAASKAFDLAVGNLGNPLNAADISSDFDRGDYKMLALIACKGIKEKL